MAAAFVSSRMLLGKGYFLALRSALKRHKILTRGRHTECAVELEIGNR